MAFLPNICRQIFPPKNIEPVEFRDELAALLISENDSEAARKSHYTAREAYDWKNAEPEKPAAPTELFYFDPNTLSAEGWQKLGLKEKTIGTIQNYLSKGGKFKNAGDIKKIWGIKPLLAEQLVPFVKIPGTPTAEKRLNGNNAPPFPRQPVLIDANSADSAAFISLPGIGPGYAKRILKFRERLGGFYSADQVGETFGLPDSTFQKVKKFIKVNRENLRKININSATNDELKQHPYIRWQMANMIIEYRQQHGKFNTVADLKKLMQVTDEWYDKVLPYLVAD